MGPTQPNAWMDPTRIRLLSGVEFYVSNDKLGSGRLSDVVTANIKATHIRNVCLQAIVFTLY